MSARLTADRLLEVLNCHLGSDNGITVSDLVREALGTTSPGLERNARQLIQELRLQGHPVAAHPAHGYFLARSAEELEYCCRFLRARAMASLVQIRKLKMVALPDLAGQIRLPVGSEPELPAGQVDLFTWATRAAKCRALAVDIPDPLWADMQRFLEENPDWDLGAAVQEALALFLLTQEATPENEGGPP